MLKWLVGLSIVLVLAGGIFAYYVPQGSGSATLTVTEGMSTKDISQMISKKTGLIEDVVFSAQSLVGKEVVSPGVYTLKLPVTALEVWRQLYPQAKVIRAQKESPARTVIKVTFPEGKSADQMVDILAKSGYTKSEEIRQYWRGFNRTLTQSYPFLAEDKRCNYGVVSECVGYYLEGFLFPATYDLFVDESPSAVTKKLLDAFAANNPEIVALPSKKVYDVLTLASIIEKETGRPGGSLSDPLLREERQLVAGVFANRSAINMRWQTDPTVEYGTNTKLCQSGRNISDCKALDDKIYTSSLYNTYVIPGAPIGPIANPSKAVITAALNPKDSDYYFFVADISGKKYFGTTLSEHENNIYKVGIINESLR